MTNDYYQSAGVASGGQTIAPDDTQTPQGPSTAQSEIITPEQQAPEQVAQESESEEKIDGETILKNLTETIVRDLGFEGASEEQKQKTLESISKRVMTAVLKAIITNASSELALEISEKIASDTVTPEDIEKALKDNPDLMAHIQNEVGLLHERMLEESKQAWNLAKTQGDAPQDDTPTPQAQTQEAQPTASEQMQEQTAATNETTMPQAQESPQTESNEDVIRKIIDDLKGQGRVVDQNSLAAAIYQARVDGKINPDISVEDQDEQTRNKMLSDWDWYKAAAMLNTSFEG